ncbi:hypothetical protein SAY86_026396 [Trapa natans]|uniref:Uncharacterized protein n=1 Tax=Trapa natans TaxID=22666 RepID=A0AAN7KJQ4_TRANT|nr:hypothetical protein SAY86_026396 [Trapa natans]
MSELDLGIRGNFKKLMTHLVDYEYAIDIQCKYGGAQKKARVQPSSAQSTIKVRKEKLGDRITALHQLVSPFGKVMQGHCHHFLPSIPHGDGITSSKAKPP